MLSEVGTCILRARVVWDSHAILFSLGSCHVAHARRCWFFLLQEFSFILFSFFPKGDLAGRLAVVPMSQEARGLDAGPRLAERLVGCGDNRTAAIVARIALEEKAHVAVGKLAASHCL